MRGEETQIMGLLLQLKPNASHTVCLPGTHSKWVQIDNGRIISFRTAMTGELYALLRNQSLLSALMPNPPQDTHDGAAFAQGVADSARSGGLTHHLFGVRTQGLLGQLSKEAAPSYLSGLLIGHELRALLPPSCPNVHLLGSSQLTLRYQEALDILGVNGHLYGDTISAIGLHRLANDAMAISLIASDKSLK
jgi:2-dehydro-3-deoxygalactonokinase